jgi:hypothetical protein
MYSMMRDMKAAVVVMVGALSLSAANAQSVSNSDWAADVFGVAVRDHQARSDQDWSDAWALAYARPARSAPAPVTLAPQPMPAVDGINGKIDGYGGGSSHGNGLYGTSGSLSIPLVYQWGLQLDGGTGSNKGIGSEGGAGHLFWRDPSIGLLGVYGSYFHWNGFDVGVSRIRADGGIDFLGTDHISVNTARVAAEGEYYVSKWNFSALAGVEMVDVNSNLLRFSVPDRFFDAIQASYYLTDNFDLHIGQVYSLKTQFLTLGTEYGLALGGGRMASLFADATFGEHGRNAVLGGVRIYFGEHDKSLIDRHRQDDPNNNQALRAQLNEEVRLLQNTLSSSPQQYTQGGTSEFQAIQTFCSTQVNHQSTCPQ